ncbi:hypothetical protein BXZ70DRAFT_793877 [Cristinia sonorae]|uniref:BTB domain-containing protein n=1 Tax=Cristinia sonorae TaxID=1940300 RepID=A0A8K0URC6_9AGAR|nr:hypothetical protein BXZ70DRAFT_793877 [Cristinia sonorae]
MAQRDIEQPKLLQSLDPDVVQVDNQDLYHPLFAHDGDSVLCSRDRTMFRIHSIVLRATSGWFRTLFTLPQPTSESDCDPRVKKSHGPLHVSEDAATLAALLQIVCGLGPPNIPDIDAAEDILVAAEKYDMAGAVSTIRHVVMHPPIISSSPLRVYSLACCRGWEDEIRMASSHTLSLDLCSDTSMAQLQRCGMSCYDLAKLMALHRQRRDDIRTKLSNPSLFSANNDSPCSKCSFKLRHARWAEFKATLIETLETHPLGAAWTLDDLWERPRLFEMLDDACPECGTPMYSVEFTLKHLKSLVQDLPQVVST